MPTIFKRERQIREPTRFPVGVDFVGGIIHEKLVLWGGTQIQTTGSGRHRYLPTEFVYIYAPGENGYSEGKWERINATGAIHPGKTRAAFTVLNDLIYIIGGNEGKSIPCNAISTLSAEGMFTRLQIDKSKLLPRLGSSAWSYNGSIYFFGGILDRKDRSKREDIVKGQKDYEFYTNETFQFEPHTNKIARLMPKGKSPSPRVKFATAQIDHFVFIQGGVGGGEELLNDLHRLDLINMEWKEIRNSGIPNGLSSHSLTGVSSNQLLLIGGEAGGVISKRVATFDIFKTKWKEETPLTG